MHVQRSKVLITLRRHTSTELIREFLSHRGFRANSLHLPKPTEALAVPHRVRSKSRFPP
jgi:hypothetical protein